MAMKLLSLLLFCTEPKQTDVKPTRAARRVSWAMDQVALALRKPDSAPGKLLNETGFCSVILVGSDNAVQHLEIFDEGFCPVVCPDGVSVEPTAKDPQANAEACLAHLDRIKRYCEWCEKVEMAEASNTRPPALEGDLNLPQLHTWVGRKALAYFERWKHEAHSQAAIRHAVPRLSFDEELLVTVKNIEERTSIAPSGRDVE